MWWGKKIRAGALQYVLVVATIIAIVVFAFITLIYVQQKLQLKNSFFKTTITNVQYGFAHIENKNLPYHTVQNFQFSELPSEKTTIVKKPWGIFDLAIISSTINNETFQKVGLLGQHNSKRDALYVKETNMPIVLVGKTKIVGNAKLPKLGLKPGNISGTSYYGNTLLYGRRSLSNTQLPSIKNLQEIQELFTLPFSEDYEFLELEDGMIKTQSFTKPTAVFETNRSIHLQHVQLQGNIIIRSKTSITVSASAKLEDVLLIAPKIRIKDNVQGSIQAFASKELIVGTHSKLLYPTSLVVLAEKAKKNAPKTAPVLQIGKQSLIKGVVLFNTEDEEQSFIPQVTIEERSVISGEVYCNKNLALYGSVYGSVYTGHFMTKKFGGVYINHLYNATIDSQQLPKAFCGLSFHHQNQKVAKWLY